MLNKFSNLPRSHFDVDVHQHAKILLTITIEDQIFNSGTKIHLSTHNMCCGIHLNHVQVIFNAWRRGGIHTVRPHLN